MSGRYLGTRGKAVLSIGICDRCSMKVPYVELRPDGNSPGLMVCAQPGCWDTLDPWRLAPRQTEDITLPHPRPDDPLV